MPCSPERVSIGSPGTRWISKKLRNVTATKVGITTLMRVMRKRNICGRTPQPHPASLPASPLPGGPRRGRRGDALLQVDRIELMAAERTQHVAGDILAHGHEHHRVRNQVEWRLLVHDHL